jgi:hypothetical protein
MTDLDKKFFTYWEEKRKKGRWNYAIINGVFLFGWPIFVFTELGKQWLFHAENIFSGTKFLSGLLIYTILGLGAFGWWMWGVNEKRFEKLSHENGDL